MKISRHSVKVSVKGVLIALVASSTINESNAVTITNLEYDTPLVRMSVTSLINNDAELKTLVLLQIENHYLADQMKKELGNEQVN